MSFSAKISVQHAVSRGMSSQLNIQKRDAVTRARKNDGVRNYSEAHCSRLPSVLEELCEATAQHPMGVMMSKKDVLSLNLTLMQAVKAKKVLDIGVFTGISSLAAALCIPSGGKVVACDLTDKCLKEIGWKFFEEAGVTQKIELRIQPALKSLEDLIAEGQEGTFDFAYIDADKVNYDNYYERCLKLLRPGGIIAFDNVLWFETVTDDGNNDESTVALRELNDKICQDSRVNATFLCIADGLTVTYKK